MKRMVATTLVPAVLTLLLAVVFYPVMNKYSQSFKFVDEAEHLVMAWLMGRGYRLYRDFPNNHQPINYIVSYGLQRTDYVDNVFMLVKRHRQLIYFWSVCWWLILFKRVGKKAVIPIFLFENLKYFTLGNEFLAESLIAYPLSYLLIDSLYLKPATETAGKHFTIGVLTTFIQLTLSPMVAALGLLTAYRYWQTRGKGWQFFLLGGITVAGTVLMFVDPRDYWREMVNVAKYSLSGLNPIATPVDYLKLIGLPVLYFRRYTDILGQTVIMMTVWWLVALGVAVFKRKPVGPTLCLLAVWLLTNMRQVTANAYYYQAFHLTPWLLAGLMGGFIAGWRVIPLMPKTAKVLTLLASSLAVAGIVIRPNLPLYAKTDPHTEHYIQYTPITQAAEIINSLKQPGDTLMVIPNESFIYFMTQVTPAPTNMITYYDWQVQVPHNRALLLNTLAETPPAFIVYNDDGSSYCPMMNEYLKQNYLQLMQYPHVYLHLKYQDRTGAANEKT